jgi:hypothetical protein
VSIRVVLYAEGSAEHGGDVRLLPAPGDELGPNHLGPAHLLVSRIVAELVPCPRAAVRFISPLRIRGRNVRGSDLQAPNNLRSLLAFPAGDRRPELGVVLVDEDGMRRRRDLRNILEGTIVPAAFGLAAPEFEAWLIATTPR